MSFSKAWWATPENETGEKESYLASSLDICYTFFISMWTMIPCRTYSWTFWKVDEMSHHQLAMNDELLFWNRPDTLVWVLAPPSSSWVTSSLVTDFTTSGPVMNRYDVSWKHTDTHMPRMWSSRHNCGVHVRFWFFKNVFTEYWNILLSFARLPHLNHEGEICQCRRVDSASCAGTHDEGDLRDDSWGHDIPLGWKKRVWFAYFICLFSVP